MPRKSKLFKKGLDYVVADAIQSIQAKSQKWVTETSTGFQTNWRDWMESVLPALVNTIRALPEKGTDISANVMNRVVPVAQAISNASKQYRARRLAGVVVTPIAPAPATVPRPR